MLKHDPFETTDQLELDELSEAVRDEEALLSRPRLPLLHEVVEELAERITQRACVGLVILDASNLGPWERQHGAAAFTLVMGRLAEFTSGMRGNGIRHDDLVCMEAAAGDTLLIFLSQPRLETAESGITVDFEEIASRLKRQLFEPFVDAQIMYHQALDLVAPGSALILHNGSVDPRREIYRAVRRARADAQVNYLGMQRRRNRVVGHMIAHRKILTVYQPVVRLPDRHMLGFEALSRAEAGDADKLGIHLFVAASRAELECELDQTCRSLSMHRRPMLATDQQLFVNCLPPTFYEPMRDLEVLIAAWQADGLRPDQLVFEVNESITHEQAARIMPAIRDLRARGFQFALDDVGTGAANLRLLADLEPEYIKMDISLTIGIAQSVRKQALASYLLELANRSNSRLIAEGIETTEDLDMLVDLGIHLGQGYLLGRPAPAEHWL
ncbi:MAG: EAL domain-containing protein [Bradymonadaceae bacterium]|nr:EAL domain-containing protein [Lujinxingiaceae bacterium]